MIPDNTTPQDLLRHLNLTEPLETGEVVGVQLTLEHNRPSSVHVRRMLPYGRGLPVLDLYKWNSGVWVKES